MCIISVNTIVIVILFSVAGSCYKDGDSMSYTGEVSMTSRNVPCKAWSSTQFIDAALFPDISVAAASNFCRYPSNIKRGPWCHDVYGMPDECDVLFCTDAGKCEPSSLFDLLST